MSMTAKHKTTLAARLAAAALCLCLIAGGCGKNSDTPAATKDTPSIQTSSVTADIDDSDEEKNSRMPMLISHGNTKFSAALDSNGTPLEKGIENTLMMLDTITFNGTTYDSVFVIMDNAHYNGLNYNEEVPGDTAYLYFSKEKGILKLETTDGKSFTIKEGGDNE